MERSITVVYRLRPVRHKPESGYSVTVARVLREDLVPVQIWVPRKIRRWQAESLWPGFLPCTELVLVQGDSQRSEENFSMGREPACPARRRQAVGRDLVPVPAHYSMMGEARLNY